MLRFRPLTSETGARDEISWCGRFVIFHSTSCVWQSVQHYSHCHHNDLPVCLESKHVGRSLSPYIAILHNVGDNRLRLLLWPRYYLVGLRARKRERSVSACSEDHLRIVVRSNFQRVATASDVVKAGAIVLSIASTFLWFGRRYVEANWKESTVTIPRIVECWPLQNQLRKSQASFRSISHQPGFSFSFLIQNSSNVIDSWSSIIELLLILWPSSAPFLPTIWRDSVPVNYCYREHFLLHVHHHHSAKAPIDSAKELMPKKQLDVGQ